MFKYNANELHIDEAKLVKMILLFYSKMCCKYAVKHLNKKIQNQEILEHPVFYVQSIFIMTHLRVSNNEHVN